MLRTPEQPVGLLSKLDLSNRRLTLYTMLSAVFAWAYWPTLVRTVAAWRTDPDYTHGFLVIPIAGAIWMRRRDRLPTGLPRPSVLGLVLLAAAALLRIAAARYYLMPLDAWSIPLWIGGVIWTLQGWATFRNTLPAIAFLWFAAPLPERVEQLMSVPLQACAATASAWILQCLCQPAVSAGTTILLGAETFEVEYACSGLRMFFGTFAMATAFVLLGAQRRGVKGLLIFLAAPIAMLANTLRIVTTALLYQHASTEILRRFVHDFAGLMMVGIVFGAYSLVLYAIRRIVRSYQANRDRFVRRLPIWPITTMAVVLLAILWHARQQQQVFASLLDTAAYYEQSQDWRRAADYLDRYLQLRRDDPSVLRRLALAAQQSAMQTSEQRRALTLLTAASKANPNDLELARRQAELAWELRQLSQVIATTSVVLQHVDIDRPENEETRRIAARLRAWAMYESLENSNEFVAFSWNDVAESLSVATRFDAEFPQHAFRLAIIYRERLHSPSPVEREKLANELIDLLVQDHPETAEVWLIRYRYRRRFQGPADVQELASIDADLERALELDARADERNVHILIASAERMRERGDTDASLNLYQMALQANARDVRPYLAVAEIWTEQGTAESREKAVEVLQQGLAIIGPNEVPLLFPMIEQLVVLRRTAEADDRVKQAARALERYPEPVRTSYRIQLQFVKSWRVAKDGDYTRAAKSLEEMLDALAPKYVHSSGSFVAQAWAIVGQYYRMADAWDEATAAYQHAAGLDEVWRLEYRWALARQSEIRGDLGEAAEQYLTLANRSNESLKAWVQAATVSLRQQILLPPSVRDWTQFRRTIDAAKAVAGDDMAEVVVLEANQLLIQGQAERATRLLHEAIKEYTESTILYRSLALVQSRRDDWDGALKTARQIHPLGGDPSESLLLQKQILCDANRADEAINLLESALSAESDKDAVTLQLELAWLYMQHARWTEARKWLDLASQTDASDLRVIETMSELAWCVEDWELLEKCETSLRVIEGTYGPIWRTFRIRRLLVQSKGDGDGAAASEAEVDELARQLEVLYPHMQQTRIAAGRVATYRGLLWRAAANYEEAWELGLPRVSLAVDLISLLNELGESDRAQRYVEEIRSFLAATETVIDQSFLDLSEESADQAIQMAEALVRDAPRSESYLRLGRMLVLTALPGQADFDDRIQRAENAFRRAVDIDPTNTRTWAALFRYLVAVKSDPVESQAVFRALAQRQDISLLNRTFVLAQLNESIENYTEADQLYRESVELVQEASVSSERLVVLERVAQYFRRFEPELAETCCRQALAMDATAVGPQQILLELLLTQETRESAIEAQGLAESLSQLGLGSDPWKRLHGRALLQASRWDDNESSETRHRAIEILEGINNKTSFDALLLAELYLLDRHTGAAITELRTVAKRLPAEGERVLRFLREYDEPLFTDARLRTLADQIYDQLEEQPRFALPALDLRCETATRRAGGSYEQRRSLASSLIRSYLREAIERCGSEDEQFDVVVELLRHLIATGRVEEAQEFACSTTDVLPSPSGAAALVTAVALSDQTVAQTQSLAQGFDSWLVDFPDDAELIFALANQKFMFGETPQAIELFRRCLQHHPHHSTSLNNLALALAVQNPASLEESFQHLNLAIELDGRKPEWLDTLAVLHLIQGDEDTAIALLLEALPNASNDELLFLHLAKAWLEKGDQAMARFALNMAESRRMKDQRLLPYDREMYQQVVNQLRESAL